MEFKFKILIALFSICSKTVEFQILCGLANSIPTNAFIHMILMESLANHSDKDEFGAVNHIS